ncbi:MAG: hypothetical protein J5685_04740 [Clostridiales bacterium]|nr:hypothetical protein [Clostridiales bacterium]
MEFLHKHTYIAKGIAFLLLLYYHMYINSSDYHGFFALTAHSGLYVFVFLSAYGLTRSLGKIEPSFRGTVRWIAQHICNLEFFFWPHFFIGVAIYVFIYKKSMLGYYGSIAKIILEFFCVSDMLGQPHIMGVWWYMGLAITIVALIVLFVKAYKKLGIFIIPITYLIMLIAPGIFRTSGFDRPGPYKGYLLAIALGTVFAGKSYMDRYMKKTAAFSAPKVILLSATYLTAILGLNFLLKVVGDNAVTAFLCFPQAVKTVSAVLLILLAMHLSRIKTAAGALGFIGKLSDDLFIMHMSVIVVLPFSTSFSGIWVVDYFVILALSIAATFLYKKLKALVKYDELTKKICSKIDPKAEYPSRERHLLTR